MMEYERFTEKVDSGFVSELDCRIAYNKLSAIEDKIEQGTMKEFNDNLIGETVYGIQQDTTGKYHFDGASNTLIGFTSNGIVTWNDIYGYNDYFTDGFGF